MLIIVLFNAYCGLISPEPLTGIGVLIAIGVNSVTASISFWQWLNYRKIDKASPSPIITGQLNLYRSKYISDTGVALTLALGLLLRKQHFEDYRNIHNIRSRRSGQNIFVDFYLEFDPGKAMSEVQKAIRQINADILGFNKNCQVNIVLCTAKPRVS